MGGFRLGVFRFLYAGIHLRVCTPDDQLSGSVVMISATLGLAADPRITTAGVKAGVLILPHISINRESYNGPLHTKPRNVP